MPAFKQLALVIAAGTALSACSGGAQYTSLFEKMSLQGPAHTAVAEAEATSSPANPYQASLRAAYLGFAGFELNKMNDYGDAIFHAKRAVQAASGQNVIVQNVGDRILTDANRSELTAARARLIEALGKGGAEVAPGPAGRATASFDCWMEQAEENIQPYDIAACKEGFEAAMAKVDAALAAKLAGEKAQRATPELPDVITLDSDVIFAFDSAKIEPNAADALVEVATIVNANPGVALLVQGHTDSIGSDAYNLGLSERRAKSVVNFLVNQGANPSRFTVQAMGERSPVASNATREGRAKNRRVEIHSQ